MNGDADMADWTTRGWRRRELLRQGAIGAALLLGGGILPRLASATEAAAAAGSGFGDAMRQAMADTDVFYLTPLKSDGSESRCQAEIWFVADDNAAYVVTDSGAWRARAVRQGLTRARIWVGDVGVWTRSDGAYRDLPMLETSASLVDDSAEHTRILDLMGDKFSLEWLIWGPRFRNGLAEGSRVMLRYQPV